MAEDGFSINVDGLTELQTALYAFNRQLGDKVVRAALRTGANQVLKQIRAAAPKKTGRLRRNIRVSNSKINNGRSGKLGVYINVRKSGDKNASTNAFYGRFQEDGYHAVGRTKGRDVTTSATTRDERAAHRQRTGRRLRVYAHREGTRVMPGKKFIKNTFSATREAALHLIVQAAERGAQILADRLGFRT